MNIIELYQRYIKIYEIELRECATHYSVELMKSIDMLEKLTIDEFKIKMNNPLFKNKWGKTE
jgi:hypothetical protein